MDHEVPVSLIVPVYNVFSYLEDCMKSLVCQTLRDIEIICVDDASTDGSWELLQRFAARDARIRLIRLDRNSSACVARARGVKASKGQYIMFVDPDDELSVNACEELYSRIEKAGCDMLQFSTEIIGIDVNSPRRKNLDHILNDHVKSADGDLVNACFLEKQFGFQLWNKIYRGDLVRRAMKNCPEEYLPKAQDLLAFFMIAHEMRSYRGQQTEPMYRYRMGVGVTGGKYLTEDQLRKNGLQLKIPGKIREYLKSRKEEEKYEPAVRAIERDLIADSLAKLIRNTYTRDREFGWRMLCESMPTEKLLQSLTEKYYTKEEDVLDICGIIAKEAPVPSETHTIGTFYPRLKNGGVQRVMAELVKTWDEMGYRVVVITEKKTEDEYELPGGVTRHCLPTFDGMDDDYKREHSGERIALLGKIIREEHIDLMVSHQWLNGFLIWDMLAAKINGAKYCIHCHSVFSVPLITRVQMHTYKLMPDVYRLADGIFTLSKTDLYYWSQYNPHTFTVVNPLPFEYMRKEPLDIRNHTILWVGRFSREKRPMDVIEIMERVVTQVPDAKLLMVGSGEPAIEDELRQAARDKGLENTIVFTGFQKDVVPYYQEASVYLSTSEYEGFSVSIGEAQINGLPVVAYDLFYLSILESRKGSLLAPIGQKASLAEMIIELLESPEKYRQVSAEALENIRRFDVDLHKQWGSIFEKLETEESQGRMDLRGKMALDTIRQQATMRTDADFLQGREGSKLLLNMAFPVPQNGPLKELRRKIAILSRVLLIDGFQGVLNRARAKRIAGEAAR